MEIYIKDRNTGRVTRGTTEQLKALGGNYVRVAPPRTKEPVVKQQPAKQEPAKQEPAKQEPEEEQEMSREQLMEAIKATGHKQKGLHLSSLDTLKKLYDEITK